jgi:hypothetical protein
VGSVRVRTTHARDSPVRLSLFLYDSAFASCFSVETTKTQKKKRLVCSCCVRCRDLISVRKTDSLLRLQLTGDFIVLALHPEAEPTRRQDLRWDKEVCLFVCFLFLCCSCCYTVSRMFCRSYRLGDSEEVCLSVCLS